MHTVIEPKQTDWNGKQISHRQIPFGPKEDGGATHGMTWQEDVAKIWIDANRLQAMIRIDPKTWEVDYLIPTTHLPGISERLHGIAYDNGFIWQVTGHQKEGSTGYEGYTPGLIKYDIKTGQVIPAEDRRMVYQLANMLWHSDSSFKPVPSLCSLLTGRIVPPEGGATEFASARAAYPSLPEDLKRRAEAAVVVHDFSWSRDQVRPGFFTAEERAVYPPVRHRLVRANPVNGRRALFLGAHASHLEGLPIDEGRALLRTLLDHVTQPEFVYRHEWEAGDLVIWDNRCVLHRATPYDTERHQRLMQRTTIAGDPAEPVVR